MAKADKDGIYTLNGHRFHIAAGDVIPEGAVLDGDESADAGEKRAVPGAPETKARKAAPENKSA